MYFVKAPWWLKLYYRRLTWNKSRSEKKVYLTFDDGPAEEITLWVLDLLQQYGAKATFFLIGKNVSAHPEIYSRILKEGHAVGNHTYNHLNGWSAQTEAYLQNIRDCNLLAPSGLFRPPYGRIKKEQIRQVRELGYEIVMWDVLSGDFDTRLSAKKCFQYVETKARNGSIIVFHDSKKAWPRLQYALPRVMHNLAQRGYSFEKLESDQAAGL